jgi:SAM-dependent methyltransferase
MKKTVFTGRVPDSSPTCASLLEHRFFNPFVVAKQLLKGKSLFRTLMNLELRAFPLVGNVLELGSKTGENTYWDFLDRAYVRNVISSDLDPGEGQLGIDVELTFPIADCSFDTVLALNLFEHVFEFRNAPSEVCRVLVPGGIVVIATPFMYPFHGDPNDFFRYTDTALVRIWESAGLECIAIKAIGEDPFTGSLTQGVSLASPRGLRSCAVTSVYFASTVADRVLSFRPPIKGKTPAMAFALGFIAVFRKL